MKDSHCKYCNAIRSHKRKLNTKKTVNEWLVLVFDFSCSECGLITWQHVECMRPNKEGGQDLIMTITNAMNTIDMLNMFEKILKDDKIKVLKNVKKNVKKMLVSAQKK